MRSVPKRYWRKYVVWDGTSIEVLKKIARTQPPSIRKIVFVGQPAFLRSGRITCVRGEPGNPTVHIDAEDVESFEPYLTNATGVRFHCGPDIGWIVRIGNTPRSAVIHWYGTALPRVGDRFYLERLPRVYGSLEDIASDRHVELRHMELSRATAWDRLKDDPSV